MLCFFGRHPLAWPFAALLLFVPTLYFVVVPAVLLVLAIALRFNITSYTHTPVPCPACHAPILITHTACPHCAARLRYAQLACDSPPPR